MENWTVAAFIGFDQPVLSRVSNDTVTRQRVGREFTDRSNKSILNRNRYEIFVGSVNAH